MGRTIPTCSVAFALTVALTHAAPASADARVDFLRSGASTFVAARAAASAGDARRAAILYASLAAADPADRVAASRALAQAILAGDMPLALRLAQQQPRGELGIDARLLLAADALKRGKGEAALGPDWPSELAFLQPYMRAWVLAERGRWREAVALLDNAKAGDMFASLVPEHKALILLAAGRPAEAQPLIAPALSAARGRANRLRIAFAEGLAAAGERTAGLALLEGRDPAQRLAAKRLAAEPRPRPPVATAAQGFSELLTALAIALNENDGRSLPLALAQIARHADPRNEQASLLLGLLLDRSGRSDDAMAVYRALPETSPFLSDARDAEVRALLEDKRAEEAIARAQAFASGPSVLVEDWTRLGDALSGGGKHQQAGEAYARAIALHDSGAPGPESWSLHLQRGAALEQAGRWEEAERSLETAHRLAPDNSIVLNYLGYTRLERGEQLDEAEALIVEASRRAPDDPSITDSLGWAQFKRGKVAEAVVTLQRAAAADPAAAEIHEHLGDALYTAGRKYEARFAWSAALVTADEDVAKRVRDKIAAGLSPASAAP